MFVDLKNVQKEFCQLIRFIIHTWQDSFINTNINMGADFWSFENKKHLWFSQLLTHQ